MMRSQAEAYPSVEDEPSEAAADSGACPLCRAPAAPAFTTFDRNRHASERRFHYHRCSGCGVVFLQNIPDDLAGYYTGGYHRAPAVSGLDRWAAYESYKLDLLRRLTPTGRVLDIGASYGAFVYLASRAGYDAEAIEADGDGCAFIREVIGVPAVQSLAPEEALRSLGAEVDVITLWHSIEHLPQPWAVVRAAAERLRAGGLLIVATPNPDGLQSRLFGERWAHVDAPRHLFLIPRASLTRVARGAGFSPRLATSADAETRRCNRMGWVRGLEESGMRVRGVWGAGAALEILARPLERGVDRGSAYIAVFEREPAR